MSIATVDDIAAALSVGQRRSFGKLGLAVAAAGNISTQFFSNGSYGAASQPPLNTAGSGYTCSSATLGALPLTNGVTQLYLAQLAICNFAHGMTYLYDRLWAASFAAPTVGGTVAITTPGALPARITDGGVGVEAWLENYTTGGASSGTLVLNYLDETGAAKSGPAFTPASAPNASRAQLIPLAAGSKGISQVVSLTNSATMTSGTYVIALKKRIAEYQVLVAAAGVPMAWAELGLPKVPNDACIEFMTFSQATNLPNILGTLTLIDK